MSACKPFHASDSFAEFNPRDDRRFYHFRLDCPWGEKIPLESRVEGAAKSLERCPYCDALDAKER